MMRRSLRFGKKQFHTRTSREFDGEFIFESGALNRYRALGNDFQPEPFAAALLRMGIWNDDVLRSLSPSYLNTYMPAALLSLVDDSSDEITLLKDFYIPGKTDGFNHLEEDLNFELQESSNSELVKEINKQLSRVNLQMNVGVKIIKGQKETEKLHSTLTLTPQLRRYLSAVRDVPSPNEGKIIASEKPKCQFGKVSIARYSRCKKWNTRSQYSQKLRIQ